MWTPVTEKTHPDHGGQVLVTFIPNAASKPVVVPARYDCGHWDWGTEHANKVRKDSDVIAWMEMPEAYDPVQARIVQLETLIHGISEQLKEHLSDIERAFLVADRKDFRQELANLKENTCLTS